jgi:hypothetical protein
VAVPETQIEWGRAFIALTITYLLIFCFAFAPHLLAPDVQRGAKNYLGVTDY